MLHALPLIAAFGLLYAADNPEPQLPTPHYHRSKSDPDWLAYAAQFHGHLGPWAAAGTRLGMAGVREAGAHGYFDVEVTCEGPFVKPPNSCFLDGLQVATGATLGKRNLHWNPGKTDEIIVRVKNTRTGAVAEVRPSERLLNLLGKLKPRVKTEDAAAGTEHDHDHQHNVEALARTIAALPDSELLTITRKADPK
jgi:formylmethanofuran dehydrogenase subunit E